jgi:hypothetical protein
MTVAGVHAVVFGVLAFLTGKFVWKLSHRLGMEGMEPKKTPQQQAPQ